MSQWNIVTYDVWGNAEDGYDVNDVRGVGSIQLEGEEHYDDAIVLKKLIEAGLFNDDVKEDDLTFDGDADIVYINDAVDGRPIACIQRDSRW